MNRIKQYKEKTLQLGEKILVPMLIIVGGVAAMVGYPLYHDDNHSVWGRVLIGVALAAIFAAIMFAIIEAKPTETSDNNQLPH